jgi:hypothetical protein
VCMCVCLRVYSEFRWISDFPVTCSSLNCNESEGRIKDR